MAEEFSLFAADYELDETLYTSRWTRIFRAYSRQRQCPVILKYLNEVQQLTDFQREYELLQSLKLPGVVGVYALEQHLGQHYLVLEDFGGESLQRLQLAGKLTLDEFLGLALKISEIISQLHNRQIMHKDINPGNLVFNAQTGQIKLIDFGIATTFSREMPGFNNPNLLQGQLPYISPEQTGRMNRVLDYRTDLYALGVTFYELLTGSLPFQLPTPSQNTLEWIHQHLAREPAAPEKFRKDIPPMLADILLKLLAKNADERYQSAFGLQADLEICLQRLQMPGQKVGFPLGQRDFPASLQISQKLYGREAARTALLETFDEVSKGQTRVLLLTGCPGIGKTVLARELYKPVTRRRGYFVAGKFEQYQCGQPYLAIVQAFSALLRYLLAEEEIVLARWRERLEQALGQNLALLTNLLPELNLISGKAETITELSTEQAQSRFVSAVQNFIRLFATAEHPLVVFLDDLQWADNASLCLLAHIVQTAGLNHFLLLGAYRDNEINAAHPLCDALASMRENGILPQQLNLKPLSEQDSVQLVADSLRCMPAQALSLAKPTYRKTGGNPFFINTFLTALSAKKYLYFNVQHRHWEWDPVQIAAYGVSDNVVEMLLQKLQALPEHLQQVVQIAACLGRHFTVSTLVLAGDFETKSLLRQLNKLVAEEALLIRASDDSNEYSFTHDRIQQAGCALLNENEKTALHYRIGQRLLQGWSITERESGIFSLVNQLNLGISLLSNQAERKQLAGLNLTAGKKAKSEMAYESALRYLQAGIDLLNEDAWNSDYDLYLALHTQATEAAWQSNELVRMEELAGAVASHARDVLDQMGVYVTRLHSKTANDDLLAAIDVGLHALDLLGIHFPDKPRIFHIFWEYIKTRWILRGKQAEDLLNLVQSTDRLHITRMRFLARLMSSVNISKKRDFLPLLTFKQVQLSVCHGNTPESPLAYAAYGIILGIVFKDIKQCFAFGEMALKLTEQQEGMFKAPVKITAVAHLKHWKGPFRNFMPLLKSAFLEGLETGNLEYMSHAYYTYSAHSFYMGHNLRQHEQEILALSAAFKQHYAHVGTEIMHYADKEYFETALVLQAKTSKNDDWLHKLKTQGGSALRLTESQNSFRAALYIETLFFSYLFCAFPKALEDVRKAEPFSSDALGTPFEILFHFYAALTYLAMLPTGSHRLQDWQLRHKAAANRKKLHLYADRAPMNYRHKYLLVEAEWQRVQGHPERAASRYEQAIAGAAENGFIQDQGLACEAAARFYLEQNNTRVARIYLFDARESYRQWGAVLKVHDLESRYPALLAMTTSASRQVSASSIITSNTRLDLDTLLQSLQTVSGEIILDKLLGRLMRLLLSNAGATKGVLLFADENHWYVQASGKAGESSRLCSPVLLEESTEAPTSFIHYAVRTGEPLVLDKPAEDPRFGQDAYFQKHPVKSALCLPIMQQGQINALAYLENDLTHAIFTPSHLEVLRPICAQAAISLENARLYGKLNEYSKTLEIKVKDRTQALEEAHQTKMRLLSAATHDLRQPIYALSLFLDTMEKHAVTDDLLELVVKSKDSLQAMQKLFDGLINISLLEADEVKPSIAPCRLQPLLARLDHEFAEMVKAEGLQWLCTSCEALVQTDAVLLERILRNLLENALKYTEHGKISLFCRLVGENETAAPDTGMKAVIQTKLEASSAYVEIEVKDTGIGIPLAQLDKVFLEFYQVSGFQRSNSKKGLGLGLAITKHLIGLLAHPLYLSSQAGRGTRFVLKIPLAQVSTDSSEETKNQLVQQNTISACVLIIGDDLATVQALQVLLQKWGCQVLTARDAHDAQRHFESMQVAPDVLVVNYRLSCGSGIQAIQQLRHTLQKPLPAILYGEDPNTDCLQMAKVEGFRLLRKPVKPAQLLRLIKYYLRGK
ncbi:AAA family ATPase [Candidatus Venteria ishoeyi]|uniref:ATP-binding response regulator n=1 Tax=Candidatus Venteria ishoeyi TaxID=1899563 RepID=UPI0025A5D932|nr:AAA family ATPase [Candidatus Venteria ishoeyi]MDM8546196.1 AAA family ATPase [Candidatus Venteria ishoeyi]